jgi:hypothetical protein
VFIDLLLRTSHNTVLELNAVDENLRALEDNRRCMQVLPELPDLVWAAAFPAHGAPSFEDVRSQFLDAPIIIVGLPSDIQNSAAQETRKTHPQKPRVGHAEARVNLQTFYRAQRPVVATFLLGLSW